MRGSGVGLAAGFVFAAGARAVGFIDEDVIVAAGADDAVDRLGELFVRGGGFVFGASLFAGDWHYGTALRSVADIESTLQSYITF